MYRVAAVPQSVDLTGFSEWLSQHGVDHHIQTEGEYYLLLVADEQARDPVFLALERYLDDAGSHRPSPPASPQQEGVHTMTHWQARPAQAPLSLGAIVLAALVAWFTQFGANQGMMLPLLIVDPTQWPVGTLGDRLAALSGTLADGQIWRLLTPDLLHFGVTHLVFNAVMLWYLGSQIEVRDGRGHWVGLFIASSLVANITQFLLAGPLFGGLSGVVYGVLGYVWLSNQFRPRFQFPPALMVVAMVWLIIGLTPFTQVLIGANMANGAHIGGLIAGLGYALLLGLIRGQKLRW